MDRAREFITTKTEIRELKEVEKEEEEEEEEVRFEKADYELRVKWGASPTEAVGFLQGPGSSGQCLLVAEVTERLRGTCIHYHVRLW